MNMPTSPGRPDEAWSTPARSPGPVVSPTVATHEVAPGGQPIVFPADADPGGRDIVSDSVAGAVANAEARYHELQGDTYGQGSQIGDLVKFGPSPLDPGAGPGLTDPSGHYYTAPRDYGDESASNVPD